MKHPLAAVLSLALVGAASAQEEEGRTADLYCRATQEISCSAVECRREAGDSIHVTVDIVQASGVGDICTYTYCRAFMLTPAPGETVDDAVTRWTGYTLSESRGSTEEQQGRPTIDYLLSISEDRSRFVLGGAENGSFGGWAGNCSRQPLD